MDILTLFQRIPKELQIEIAVTYLGDWKYKNGKIVFDFTNLYSKIPKIKYISANKFINNNEFIYVSIKMYRCELKINRHKKYVFDYTEKREYGEDEYEIDENEMAIFDFEMADSFNDYAVQCDPKGGKLLELFNWYMINVNHYIKNDATNTTDKYKMKEKLLFIAYQY